MAERVRWHRSVFFRLFLVMVAATLGVFAAVAGLFVTVIGGNLHTFRLIADDHARLLAAAGPDEAHARELAARLHVAIRYEGPGGSWATDPGIPSIAEAEHAQASGGLSLGGAVDVTIAPAPAGGRYLFSWGHERRLVAAHTRFLVLTSLLVLAIAVLAHEVIRRSLLPLRALRSGVERLSEGELDVVLPASSRDEFGALTEAFNDMARRVREMVASRHRLLRDVSHELRSPLTRMKVALALLPDGERKRGVESDVARMERLIAELLELERLSDGRALSLGRHDLVPILRGAAEAFEGSPPGVVLAVGEGELPARVDPEKVRTVVRNLLENAVKYALPDSAPVEVAASREGAFVEVRVKDDGPGIPEPERGGLFEPFFRVDRSRSTKTGGYGLGLSICRRVMEAHGGSIAFEPSPRRGATFVVRFPAGS